MAISITQLESELQTQITALSSGSTHDDLLMTALSIAEINVQNRKFSVSVVGDLPDIETDSIPAGTVVFVENYQVPVICDGYSWRGLDGRRLRSDVIEDRGEIWVFGNNNYGNLGTGNTTCYSSPVQESLGYNTWIDVTAGSTANSDDPYSRSFAINKTNYNYYGWGDGTYTLGLNDTISRSIPTPGPNPSWKKIRAGSSHTLLLENDATNPRLFAFGFNNLGQLGGNNLTSRSLPFPVTGNIDNWSDIAAGENFSFGLRSNGTLWGWGLNNYGQLGVNNITCYSSPVQETSSSTTWTKINTGKNHTAAIKSDGTLWLWGRNDRGQLGTNNVTCYSSPVQEISSSTDWTEVECGTSYTMAIKTNGELWVWGFNYSGELGTGNKISYSSPVQEVSSSTNWASVHCTKIGADNASRHTIGIKTDGTLWGWGGNGRGELGTNNTISYSSPVQEISSSTDWTTAAASYRYTLGIRNKL